jgi:hypothetical protein
VCQRCWYGAELGGGVVGRARIRSAHMDSKATRGQGRVVGEVPQALHPTEDAGIAWSQARPGSAEHVQCNGTVACHLTEHEGLSVQSSNSHKHRNAARHIAHGTDSRPRQECTTEPRPRLHCEMLLYAAKASG